MSITGLVAIKCVHRLAQRLDNLEGKYIDEARRMIRHVFEERGLQGSEVDGLAIDDVVGRIKANFINPNLLIVDAWLHDAEGPNPTPEIAAWLDAVKHSLVTLQKWHYLSSLVHCIGVGWICAMERLGW